TQLLVRDCLRDVANIVKRFELGAEGMTLKRTLELAQLAVLCNSHARLETEWLNPIRIQQVHDLILNIRPDYTEYNNKKRDLMSRYDKSFLDLDLDQLIENFSSIIYRSFAHWLHPGFYRDKKTILRTTRTHTLPASILEDLLKARELIRLHRRL